MKCAAVDGALSVTFPGSKIPMWFKEHNGHQIVLKLLPKWQTRIAGFAVCGVFKPLLFSVLSFTNYFVDFRFESDGMFIPEFEVEHINASTTAEDRSVWLGYIPFSSLHQDDGFQHDWFHTIEGNLFITVRYLKGVEKKQ
ncbi:hypothetical protein L1987_39640 [Smallanthus sonchifolius]|uniref:Uncharacterized protein n=1 Tax=Smallanthus sonchifolius TaxID=185202 RepID=A0ACB9HNQ7_9ASTR|nr:hypothetical protein L1987_39640 [Smallanthus sonchifolius]